MLSSFRRNVAPPLTFLTFFAHMHSGVRKGLFMFAGKNDALLQGQSPTKNASLLEPSHRRMAESLLSDPA